MAATTQTTALTTAAAQLLPGITPTALQPIVAQAIGATTQSPLPVQAPTPLAVGYTPPPIAPPKSKMPLILGVSGGVVGLGLVAWLLLRKKKGRR